MTPKQVWDYYGNSYRFRKRTGMSDRSLMNWIKWGFVPEYSQFKIERLSKGDLIAEFKDDVNE